jgi:hypothetical protein
MARNSALLLSTRRSRETLPDLGGRLPRGVFSLAAPLAARGSSVDRKVPIRWRWESADGDLSFIFVCLNDWEQGEAYAMMEQLPAMVRAWAEPMPIAERYPVISPRRARASPAHQPPGKPALRAPQRLAPHRRAFAVDTVDRGRGVPSIAPEEQGLERRRQSRAALGR